MGYSRVRRNARRIQCRVSRFTYAVLSLTYTMYIPKPIRREAERKETW